MYSVAAILSLVAVASAGLLPQQPTNNIYLPPSSVSSFSSSSINSNNIAAARQIAIVRQVNENNGDGTFTYSYETEDGQTAEARGQLQADGAEGSQATQGSFSFTAPDGVRYTVTYTAGANGFEAQGAHLPVGPAIPEAIAKALADNAADEARGIFDDGSYREEGSQRASFGVTQGYSSSRTQQAVYSQTGYPQGQQGYPQGQQGYQIPVPNRQLRF